MGETGIMCPRGCVVPNVQGGGCPLNHFFGHLRASGREFHKNRRVTPSYTWHGQQIISTGTYDYFSFCVGRYIP